VFTDRSHLIEQNPPMLGYGICVTDVDGDGRFEFFVAGFGFPNRTLAWEEGRLVDRFDRALSAYERQAIGVAAADIDGDGREEIYVLNTDTFSGAKRFGDHLFARRDYQWVDLFTLPQNEDVINRLAGRSVCAVDRTGGGLYDFLVANYGGPMRLYEHGDGDDLYDVARRAGVALTAGGRALVSLPLVSPPGQMDIFAANENSPNFLFVSRGDGTFSEQAQPMGIADAGGHGRGVAVLDADGDGYFDVVVGNWQDEHRLWMQVAPGYFEDAATPEMRRPSAVRTVIAADFDNDGYEEIFFNNIGESNRLFGWRDGEWMRLDIGDAAEPGALGTGAAVADLDGDGRLELLVSHGESDSQPLSLYHPEPNDNACVRIQPLTPYGAPARGALVTLTAGGRTQRRAIDAGSGYLCQMEPVAHFGLGAVRTVEQVGIVWPGGARAVIETPPIGPTVTVPHPDAGT
jgi:hypothetical protein